MVVRCCFELYAFSRFCWLRGKDSGIGLGLWLEGLGRWSLIGSGKKMGCADGVGLVLLNWIDHNIVKNVGVI